MVCDKCGPSREQGFSFCPECGNPLKKGCVYCAQYEREGYEFCGKCGSPLNPTKVVATPGPMKMAALTVMPFVLIMLVAEAIFMIAGVGDVFAYLDTYAIDVLLLLPALTSVGILQGSALQALWIVIFITILASLGLMLWQSKAMFKPRKDGDTSEAEKTPFYWYCLLFAATFAIQFVLSIVMIAVNGDVEIPPSLQNMDRPQELFEMANAAFWEEIMSRVMIIGIPMTILAACYGRKDFLAHLLGGFGMSRFALFLLIVSSFLFGYAHVGGWGLWKLIPTFIGGLVMGYLYIRFGLHVAIAFHFGVDYMSVLAVGDAGMMLVGGLGILLMVIGVVCLAVVLKKMSVGIRNISKLPVTGLEPYSRDRTE